MEPLIGNLDAIYKIIDSNTQEVIVSITKYAPLKEVIDMSIGPVNSISGISKDKVIQNFGSFWCLANVKGCGKFGEEWHTDRILDKKSHLIVFIDTVNHLTLNAYTRPSKLDLIGVSNMGMVAFVVGQLHPDIFRTIIIKVAVINMFRFYLFTHEFLWKDDYGDPSIKKCFGNLLNYFLLHTLRIPSKPIQ